MYVIKNIPVGCVLPIWWPCPIVSHCFMSRIGGWVRVPIPHPSSGHTNPWTYPPTPWRDLVPDIPIPRKGPGTRDTLLWTDTRLSKNYLPPTLRMSLLFWDKSLLYQVWQQGAGKEISSMSKLGKIILHAWNIPTYSRSLKYSRSTIFYTKPMHV